MSSHHALHVTQPQPTRRQPRVAPSQQPRRTPRLRVVPTAAPAPPLVRLVAAVVAISAFGLVAVLVLHTVLAQDAYRLHDAQRVASQLKAQQESLAHQVDALNDPASIAAKAAALGMVPSGSPVFITPTGKTLGAALPKGTSVTYPATAPASGLVTITPSSSPSSGPSSRPSAGPSARPSARPSSPPSAKPSPSGH